MMSRSAKIRLAGSLILTLALGCPAGRMILDGGIVLAIVFGLVCPYFVARLAGTLEVVVASFVNLVMWISAISFNYLWWLDHSDDPWRSFTRGLGRDVILGLAFAFLGGAIGAWVGRANRGQKSPNLR